MELTQKRRQGAHRASDGTLESSLRGRMQMKNERRKIGIRKWSKYQRSVSKNRRDWIAVDTEMLADVEIRGLKPEVFKCWIGILLHAGKVGNNFNMSATIAKDLFGLRRPADFDALVRAGLITLDADDQAEPDEPVEKPVAPEKKVSKRKPVKKVEDCRFDDFWKAYPAKKNKAKAKEVWQRKSSKFNALADNLIADVTNRASSDRAWLGGFIPHATTYLNGERWEDDIELPRDSMTKTKQAMQEFLK